MFLPPPLGGGGGGGAFYLLSFFVTSSRAARLKCMREDHYFKRHTAGDAKTEGWGSAFSSSHSTVISAKYSPPLFGHFVVARLRIAIFLPQFYGQPGETFAKSAITKAKVTQKGLK